jgi:YcaO-like protein with predicted kinase domain
MLMSGIFFKTEVLPQPIMEPKAYRLGTHRALTPQDTLNRVQPLLKSMGITRVANVTGLDRVGIPVFTSFRPQSRSISVSQGKGSETLAAKVSAIMESVETFHAEAIAKPLRYGSINTLKEQLNLADTDQMARAGNKVLGGDDSIFWIDGHNLLEGQPCWLPLEPVSTDYTLPYLKGSGYFAANTNGLASGNSLIEATCHAIYEIVERDAGALWNQQTDRDRAATGVDTNSIDDANCRWLLDRFRAANIEVNVWDITSDTKLPCYTCLAMGDDRDWADPEFGTGCHATKEVALARALTEAAQARATFIAGSRDDIGLSEYQHKQRRKRRAQGLQLQTHQPARQFNEQTSDDNAYMEDDLKLCLQRLVDIDIDQVISVDLSKPEFGLAVVKVVIPGLEGAYGHGNGAYVPGHRARSLLKLPFNIYGE